MNFATAYDALLVVSFGGPEGPQDVMPFLEHVVRGKPVPRERLLQVAEHYAHFGGVSPINQQCRELIAALQVELQRAGIELPIYWGNRNWHPFIEDTLCEMARSGIRRVLAIFTSIFSSYSGCRQYRENIAQACERIGAAAPQVDRLRFGFNHPGFIRAQADRVREKLPLVKPGLKPRIIFTAHSIPLSMARQCAYEVQLIEASRLVAEELPCSSEGWLLAYQSRSGRPEDPWLEPDILTALPMLSAEREAAVVVPIGFLSDHMEVLYDLDIEAQGWADAHGLQMLRAGTVGCHPEFIRMLRELIEERLGKREGRTAIGRLPPNHDVCPADCCLPPARPVRTPASSA
ncbi:MAG: ferrochelatase [Planctomycetaceae bacterium]|nr:MAG: ferrochelatase [Planctomycetaceae bacterium]